MRRRTEANKGFRGEYVHTIPAGTQGGKKERRQRQTKGYRPGRKGAQ